MKHVLPPLPYDHAALEPHIDAHDDVAARQALRYLNGWSPLIYCEQIGRRFAHGDSTAERVWENEGGLLAAVN